MRVRPASHAPAAADHARHAGRCLVPAAASCQPLPGPSCDGKPAPHGASTGRLIVASSAAGRRDVRRLPPTAAPLPSTEHADACAVATCGGCADRRQQQQQQQQPCTAVVAADVQSLSLHFSNALQLHRPLRPHRSRGLWRRRLRLEQLQGAVDLPGADGLRGEFGAPSRAGQGCQPAHQSLCISEPGAPVRRSASEPTSPPLHIIISHASLTHVCSLAGMR
jgi:predicted metal-binding protein